MSPLEPEALVTLVTTDLAGITRGRSIPARSYESDPSTTVGWVPANSSLTPFGVIADPNPWGSVGDLRLRPDRDARYRCRPPGAHTAWDVVMSDIVELDGSAWSTCPRTFLRSALDDVRSTSGLDVVGAFEHEFVLRGPALDPPAAAFSLDAMRRVDPLAGVIVAALAAAGIPVEAIIAEYGAAQYEVSVEPSRNVKIADDAVALREIIREVCRTGGVGVSFAPKTAPAAIGNGVHLHLSLVDREGRNALFDPAGPGRLSRLGGSFAAGIVRHMPALLALTAPSPVSYLRLRPHQWSASYTWLGDRDREASLRICPTPSLHGRDPARSFNLEYRALDATACPHLALGAILRAGLEGIRADLPAPTIFSGDPGLLSVDERARLGLQRLPGTLSEAVTALHRDTIAAGFLPPLALETYLGMKATEESLAATWDDEETCRRYAAIY